MVCLLHKSLYGLKQSPRMWYKRFNKLATHGGCCRSSYDSCVYFKVTHNNNYVYLLLYVDDMLADSNGEEINEVKEMLKIEYDMKDLGPAQKNPSNGDSKR